MITILVYHAICLGQVNVCFTLGFVMPNMRDDFPEAGSWANGRSWTNSVLCTRKLGESSGFLPRKDDSCGKCCRGWAFSFRLFLAPRTRKVLRIRKAREEPFEVAYEPTASLAVDSCW